MMNSIEKYHKSEKFKEAQSRYRRKIRMTVLQYYSYGTLQCKQCGISNDKVLTIDHIKNGGTQHRKELNNRGGWHFYQWLIKNDFPKDYQVLCMNCQFIKKHEGW